jgi:hypothetical protein
MMDDLQQAYSAYQQALYHLRDPKVGLKAELGNQTLTGLLGTEIVVWHWHTL